jgi:anti-sigma B factor antagonist
MAARPPNGVTVDVHRDRNALVVWATGELDMSSTEELKNGLRRAFESRAGLIVLDLRGITFMDSTGTRLLLWAADRSRETGDRLRIDCGGAVRRLLELTQLDRSLPLAG